ncbi:MAG: hypothetical protein KGZ58_14290 [Ignavibacteriales bacterium]|nr:hypothetical protein [Ignavibacteriales bacterium]
MKSHLLCKLSYGNIFLNLLGWFFLIVITFGIAAPFFGFWMVKYILNHTEIVEGGVQE